MISEWWPSQVYYKKDGIWHRKGPGMVTGIENKQVFVSHGGICVTVNQCNLQLVNEPSPRKLRSDPVMNHLMEWDWELIN